MKIPPSKAVFFCAIAPKCRDVPFDTYDMATPKRETHESTTTAGVKRLATQTLLSRIIHAAAACGRSGMSLLCCGAIGKGNFNFKLTFALRLA